MFSVIIPIYNRFSVLQRAVESVLLQKFQEFEIILVDDGSSEDVNFILEKFIDSRLRIIRSLHMGASVARNVGIANARFEWIAFLDSDDWWVPEKLDRFRSFISQNPAFDFVYSGFSYWDDVKNVATPIIHLPTKDLKHILLVNNIIYGTSIAVVKRSRLQEVNGFDISFPARQDIDLYVRLSRIIEFGFIAESLCFISFKSEKRISSNPVNRLIGYMMFYRKHRSYMDFSQRSYTCKRILYFAYRCKNWRVIFQFVIPAIPSIVLKLKY
jgi:glycosyltransferase involved in cell wall biosynthesis